jgi:Spy/CpxP family protein refolding chaperone
MRGPGRLAAAVVVGLLLGVRGGAAQPPGGPPPEGPPPRRALEARVRDRIEEIMRDRLELTDDQARQLRDVLGRLEPDRTALVRDERETRAALRAELLAGSQGNEARIKELMDRLLVIDRRKLEFREREQSELSRVLSPGQRARYFALQDELRRSMAEFQRRRMEQGALAPRRPRLDRRPPPDR